VSFVPIKSFSLEARGEVIEFQCYHCHEHTKVVGRYVTAAREDYWQRRAERLATILNALEAERRAFRDALNDISAERQNFQDRGDARDIATFHAVIDLAEKALRAPLPSAEKPRTAVTDEPMRP
jgi:hypothetical protein